MRAERNLVARLRPPRRDRDAGNLLVLEAILVGLLLFGGIYYVLSFGQSTSDSALARNDIRLAGQDSLVVVSGLTACDGLADGLRDQCEDVYGQSLLKRHVTEALVGEQTNLSLKMKTLLPPGVAWNLYLDNSVGSIAILDERHAPGERVSAQIPFTPEWNHTVVVKQRSSYAGTPDRDNAMVVHGLPVWKSRAVLHESSDRLPIGFQTGRKMYLDNVTVDAPRGNLSSMAYWNFNEGSGTEAWNASRDAATLALDSSARWKPGRVGTSVEFVDSTDVLQTSDLEPGPATITMMGWVWVDALPVGASARIMTYTTDSGQDLELLLGTEGAPYARMDGDVATEARGSALTLKTWYHLAVTYETGTLKLYVDGKLAATKTPSVTLTAGTPTFKLGGVDGSLEALQGRIDEVRLYRRVVAEDEFSIMRWGLATAWDANGGTAGARGMASHVTWGNVPLTGSARYRVESAGPFSTYALALTKAVNDSTVGAYHNKTWSRNIPIGEEVAIEFDFGPVLRHLKEQSLNLDPAKKVYATVSVRSPVSQPPGTNAKVHELENMTIVGHRGYLNFTLPAGTMPGSHVVVASLNVTLDSGAGMVLNKVDYFNVVLPRTSTVPVNPFYRVVLEMWLPEWR